MSDGESSNEGEDLLDDIGLAPSLYELPTYFRQTRKRKIVKSVSEQYIRQDLGYGCHFVVDDAKRPRNKNVDTVVGKPVTIESVQELVTLLKPSVKAEPQALVVCDTNVLLHNMDILEGTEKEMPNIVVPQTALVECKANRMVSYDRTVDILRSVGKDKNRRFCVFFPDPHHCMTAYTQTSETDESSMSINDKNDLRIRNVAKYLGDSLKGTGIRVILLTDDKESRKLAALESKSYKAFSVKDWMIELQKYYPEVNLVDRVAQLQSKFELGEKNTKQDIFPPHIGADDLSMGIKSGKYHRGVFRAQGLDRGTVSIRQGEDRIVVTLLNQRDCNRAVDGDVVAILLNPLEKWVSSQPGDLKKSASVTGIADETAEPSIGELTNVKEDITVNEINLRPTGRVVGIIRRNFGSYSGSIHSKLLQSNDKDLTENEKLVALYEKEHVDGTHQCIFFPVDKKISPILIRTSQHDRLIGQRIIVTIDSWPVDSPLPLGHYVNTIGEAGSKDVETEVLLQEFSIPHEPFPASVLACLPPDDYKIDLESSPGREDLRHLPILSIDPPNCKDIDDALHCIVLPNGNLQAGVHIADVTHYVKPGTPIDLEAANRSTSTYLVNKRLDMLPGLLTTDLCSLKGNVDRFAFSVIWELTPNAQIVNVEFKKSIIHSIGALTYQQAQTMIDQDGNGDDPQSKAVKSLANLARQFRKRRIEAGALTLASPEVKFVLDSESLNPTDVQAYTLLEANAVVEEFMLLANVTVSKKILRHYPTLSVLRRHPAPNRSMFDDLISKAKCLGFDINIEDSKQLADSLDAAQLPSDPYINKLLRILSTRCMSPAQYFCSGEFKATDWHHYGLAAPVYTHFTSPIRRYADVCVHRLLAAAIGVAPLPPLLSSRNYLHDLCANMNRRHRAAQLAGRASVNLHTLIFFSGDGEKEESAYVLDVDVIEGSVPALTVMVPRYGIEGKILISSGIENLERDSPNHRVSFKKGGMDFSVQVFDRITVKLWVKESQQHHRELVIDFLDLPSAMKRKSEKESHERKTKKAKII